ncbi:helix-turn-helix transcriptional regulator [Amycolatopsis sp. GM8]|uniref:ArsR/SmtB family transcription factor n=1 Tax=Amycolatopsis sp. GM8 TaxID=2896530 RepID=UPI001EFF66E4|nr:metalloregulator ArsR/SmtB family transcription factor [Amycolatopsis sp. GM8]
MGTELAFDALADPVRRQILGVLAERAECSVGELVENIDSVGRTGVSSHLRVLRAAGLVTERKAGRFRYYSIDPTGPARDVIDMLHSLFQGALADAGRAADARGKTTDRDIRSA